MTEVQSLVRAAALLEALRVNGPSGVRDLSDRLDLPAGTVHRLARTLVSLGLVQQLDDRRYVLGVRLVPLGLAANEAIASHARPTLERLAQHFEESANLASLSGGRAEYLAQVAGTHSMRMFTEVGRRVPLHSTGVGKAMLSTMDDSAVLEILASQGMPASTPKTIVDPAPMLEQLAHIREVGYAVDDEEMELGVRCVAVAFPGPNLLAVSVSGPSSRFTTEAVVSAAPTVVAAARSLEAAFGSAEDRVGAGE
jgi:IclR family transcriptional regulator, acetate operon repressor